MVHTKIDEVIFDGISYDPYNLPPEVKEKIADIFYKSLIKVLNQSRN